jgi:hypothetical protein
MNLLPHVESIHVKNYFQLLPVLKPEMSPSTAHVFHGPLSHFLYELPVWWLKEQPKCSKHLNTFSFQSSTRVLPRVLRYDFSTFPRTSKPVCGAGKSNTTSAKLQLCLRRLQAKPYTLGQTLRSKVVKVGLQSPRVVHGTPLSLYTTDTLALSAFTMA